MIHVIFSHHSYLFNGTELGCSHCAVARIISSHASYTPSSHIQIAIHCTYIMCNDIAFHIVAAAPSSL